jgi:hypothetical protein
MKIAIPVMIGIFLGDCLYDGFGSAVRSLPIGVGCQATFVIV